MEKVRRVYVEKKPGFDGEAGRLRGELADFLQGQFPELRELRGLRILRRYDAEGLDEAGFARAVSAVFSEPQCDRVLDGEAVPSEPGDSFFGVEYAAGQYDQRADSAEQCVALVSGVRARVRCADFYLFENGGKPLSAPCLEAVKHYLINPVDSREAQIALPASLEEEEKAPPDVEVLAGFVNSASPAQREEYRRRFGLAMSPEDLAFCQAHFASIHREPTLAELRVLDTYWSDHCRHTTFTTALETIEIAEGPLREALRGALTLYHKAREEVYGEEARNRKITLMDMATIGAKALKKRGLCDDVDESKEINACTVTVNAEFADGTTEPWLLLFKNETHNHPTEIEPFGGAATCLGGAIRDPLAGRAFVHQAMRVTGGGDPRAAAGDTLPGKLPQVKIAREAAAGYSSYGNQIGLATGQVAEFYHPGFRAKRMELGAVVGAAPASWVRREEPAPGDVVLLVGGRTGRDGIGGATGSSKAHTGQSVETAGAEVQKGNPVEERKLQRLFRNPRVTALIKRCNDFGAGGVSVAVGELAAGLDINLDRVLKKYAGLDGTELALSESQERMAVVTSPEDAETFIQAAAAENLDAVIIANVTAGEEASGHTPPSLRMTWRGKTIVDLSRDFLNSNGAPRSAKAALPASYAQTAREETAASSTLSPRAVLDALEKELASLRSCSRRGLQERFDGSIGAGSVLFPFGGKEQGTPECGMASLLPSREKESLTASLLCFGYDPAAMSRNPYEGAKGSVREAAAKIACLGGDPFACRLSLQEYFAHPETPELWGAPAAALLGALEAQFALGIPAVGGKDSMSGTFRDREHGLDLAVPPTLVAFAAGVCRAANVRSGALSGESGNPVVLLSQRGGEEWRRFRANMNALAELSKTGAVKAAYPVGAGGTAAALAVMAFGNMTGLEVSARAMELADEETVQGSVLVELDGAAFDGAKRVLAACEAEGGFWTVAARTTGEKVFRVKTDAGTAETPLELLRRSYESPLNQVYPQTSGKGEIENGNNPDASTSQIPVPRSTLPAAPLVVLPVFPGTNCEWDMERAFRKAGARTRLVVFRNRSGTDIQESLRELAGAIGEAQIVALSGGFSAGDEPDGSGKFIANVFRARAISDAVTELLENRGGLVLGICNGFQALIKLGLLPYGVIKTAAREGMPTLTFNRIGRHVSRMVRTRVMRSPSPWLSRESEGTIHVIPVSHGEGRVAIDDAEAARLFAAGQVPFCYADAEGRPTMKEPDNPNGSAFAIEGLTSPDGRVLGKMGHSERCGAFVHINIPGSKNQRIFEAGVRYFR
ncbi:MAG: phosphoribosylformylglycinamidine synthase [Treponematales bacterium]